MFFSLCKLTQQNISETMMLFMRIQLFNIRFYAQFLQKVAA